MGLSQVAGLQAGSVMSLDSTDVQGVAAAAAAVTCAAGTGSRAVVSDGEANLGGQVSGDDALFSPTTDLFCNGDKLALFWRGPPKTCCCCCCTGDLTCINIGLILTEKLPAGNLLTGMLAGKNGLGIWLLQRC